MSATLLADAAVTETMFEVWDSMSSDPKQQFTRQGKTLKHFRPRMMDLVGERWHFNMYIGAPQAARMNLFSAVRAQGYTVPVGRKIENQRLSYDSDDLRALETTVQINDWADTFTGTRVEALWKAGSKLITEARRDFAERANVALHQDSTVTLAKESATAKKITDGTAATTETEVYITVDEGSIARFHRNLAIDIRAAGASGTIRTSGFVKVVSADGLGPRLAGGAAGTGRISGFADTVGIVVDYDATLKTAAGGADTDFSNVADGDEIVIHLEGDVGINGLPAWWTNTENPYFDKDGSAIDRDDGAHEYMFPHEIDKTSGGSNTNIDMEDHFDELGDFLPDLVATGRDRRVADLGGSSPQNGIFWKESLLAIGRQDLINDSAKDGQSTIRFTTVAASGLSSAEQKRLTGVVGFTGTVYFSPTMGHITLQADPVSNPNVLYILDPNSWFLLQKKGGMGTMNWIRNDAGGVMHRVLSSGLLTYERVASANTLFQLSSDQPMANARIRGIKSSRASA